MNTKNNQRAKKSIKKIETSLFKLLQALTHKKLTIKSICEEAKINRTTFYAHFDSIEDAFYCICENYIKKIFMVFLNERIEYKIRIKQALNIIKEQESFFEYIFMNVHNLELHVLKILEDNWSELKQFQDYEKSKLSLSFMVAGLIGVGKTYFSDLKNNKTPKFSSDDFVDLICNVVRFDNQYLDIK